MSVENLHHGHELVDLLHDAPQNRSYRPDRGAGRNPAVSSSYNSKNTASSLEFIVFCLRKASFVSGPALLNAEWCRAAVSSMRTVIRSCRSHERRWRCSQSSHVQPSSCRPFKSVHSGQTLCCCGCCRFKNVLHSKRTKTSSISSVKCFASLTRPKKMSLFFGEDSVEILEPQRQTLDIDEDFASKTLERFEDFDFFCIFHFPCFSFFFFVPVFHVCMFFITFILDTKKRKKSSRIAECKYDDFPL